MSIVTTRTVNLTKVIRIEQQDYGTHKEDMHILIRRAIDLCKELNYVYSFDPRDVQWIDS